jgi:hypothetical protein
MEAVRYSKTSVNFYRTTRGQIAENSTLPNHRSENLNSNTANPFLGVERASGYTLVILTEKGKVVRVPN